MRKPNKAIQLVYSTLQVLTIILHYIVFIGLIVSPVFAMMYTPWYVWLPIAVYVVRIPFSRTICPLSTLEGYWEAKQGKIPKPPKFMKFYIIRPVKYILEKIKST